MDGVADVLDGLYSYGTQTMDRLAFQKALDDIAANESAGYGFSLDRAEGSLLARRGAAGGQRAAPCPAGAGLRSGEAADGAVCRGESEEPVVQDVAGAGPGAAAGGRSFAAGGDAGDAGEGDAGGCEAVSRQHGAAGPDDDRGDRRCDAGGGEGGHREVVWGLEGGGAEAGDDAAAGSGQQGFGCECGRSGGGAGLGGSGGGAER